jgi:hypothetical protein
MPSANTFPSSVVISLWLNAARGGYVSNTDAANAIESITNQIEIADGMQALAITKTWLDVVNLAVHADNPVAVALPIDGDPAGVPVGLLAQIQRTAGVMALSNNLMLVQDHTQGWAIVTMENKIVHYDLSQTHRMLLEQIEKSATKLAASELVGDEGEVTSALKSFQTFHTPPHLTKRSCDALELAARIMIVAAGARSNAIALHSPSIDRRREAELTELLNHGRLVLQSVVAR